MLKVFSAICLSLHSGLQMLLSTLTSFDGNSKKHSCYVGIKTSRIHFQAQPTVSELLVKESDGPPYHARR